MVTVKFWALLKIQIYPSSIILLYPTSRKIISLSSDSVPVAHMFSQSFCETCSDGQTLWATGGICYCCLFSPTFSTLIITQYHILGQSHLYFYATAMLIIMEYSTLNNISICNTVSGITGVELHQNPSYECINWGLAKWALATLELIHAMRVVIVEDELG